MVVLDASVLIKLFNIKKATRDEKKKLDHLIQTLEEDRERVIIPTPALAEYLSHAGNAASELLDVLRKQSIFELAPFDQRAAVECAVAINRDKTAGDKRGGANATWAKVKFDRQIVAIAKVNRASVIYTDDDDIRRIAPRDGIKAVSVADLPLPPSDKQVGLFEEE